MRNGLQYKEVVGFAENRCYSRTFAFREHFTLGGVPAIELVAVGRRQHRDLSFDDLSRVSAHASRVRLNLDRRKPLLAWTASGNSARVLAVVRRLDRAFTLPSSLHGSLRRSFASLSPSLALAAGVSDSVGLD